MNQRPRHGRRRAMFCSDERLQLIIRNLVECDALAQATGVVAMCSIQLHRGLPMRDVRPGDHGCLLALPAMLLRSYGCRLRARTSSRLLVFPCCPYAQRVDRLYRSAVWLTDKDTGLRVHTLSCPDGTVLPNAVSAHYTWDPNTLAGTVQI